MPLLINPCLMSAPGSRLHRTLFAIPRNPSSTRRRREDQSLPRSAVPPMNQYRTSAILLLALCLLASVFYLGVWSAINPGSDQRAAAALQNLGIESKATSHHHHPHQQNVDDKVRPTIGAVTKQPFPSQTLDSQDINDTIDPSSVPPPSLPVPPQTPLLSKVRQHKGEKQRLKELQKLQQPERLERERKKEEKQTVEQQRLENLFAQPFPALTSTNNARVAGLNLRAFARFCHGQSHDLSSEGKKEQEEVAEPSLNKGDSEGVQDGETQPLVVMDQDFDTYEEWAEYIRNKNLARAQQPLLPSTVSHTPLESSDLQQGQLQKTRPLFWERPLRGWIVNYTGILGPCDRTKHTSVHCLSYLSQDHLYLVSSHKSGLYPNRVLDIVSPDRKLEPENIELGTFTGRENIPTTTSRASATTTNEMMHFHIFWRGVITDKLSLAAHAFLFTQPLDRARLHLWIDSADLPGGDPEDYALNPFAKDLVSAPLNRFVKLHAWNQKAQEAYAYPPQATEPSTGETGRPDRAARVAPVELSDQARFLILYHYGGMYLDADVLLLRDMSPFYDMGMEFAYEWSSTQLYNTAVLRLNRGSDVARRVLDGAKIKEKEIEKEEKERKRLAALNGLNVDELELRMLQNASKAKKRARGKPKQPRLEQEEQRLGNVSPAVASSPTMVTEGLEDDDSLDHGESLFASESLGASISPPRLIERREMRHKEMRHKEMRHKEMRHKEMRHKEMRHKEMRQKEMRQKEMRHKKTKEMRPNEVYHPARLRKYLDPDHDTIANNGLTMMPTMIFDPLWLRVDHVESQDGLKTDREEMIKDLIAFPDALTNPRVVCPAKERQRERGEQSTERESIEDGGDRDFTAGPEVFFTGAYAYHWHNSWETPIDPQSWLGLMRQAYDEFLAGRRPNLYGEWF